MSAPRSILAAKVTPIDEEIGGDTSLLDNVVELMNAAGRDLAEAPRWGAHSGTHAQPEVAEEEESTCSGEWSLGAS